MQAPDPVIAASGTASAQKQSKRTYKKGKKDVSSSRAPG